MKIGKGIASSIIAMALVGTVSLTGCGSSSMQPTSQQESATLNAAALSTGVQTSDMYDKVWTMSETSDGCYKVTVKYKYDQNGNTKENTFSSYFESQTSATYCPKASKHVSDRL